MTNDIVPLPLGEGKKRKVLLFNGILGEGFMLLLVLFLMFGFTAPAIADYVPDEVIVKFKTTPISIQSTDRIADVKFKSIEKIFKDAKPPKYKIKSLNNKQVELPDLSTIYHIKLPRGSNVESVIKQLQMSPNIEYAEPNSILKASRTPNDAYYSSQWGLPKISAEVAWDITTGTSDVVVAVVDTGIYFNHADLSGKIILGQNYVNEGSDPLDDNGHGTHVAGIVGAITNNNTGIAGTNWNCRLMAVKVLDSAGGGSIPNVTRGIKYAADNGADVINMSFGQYENDSTLRNTIISAYAAGSVLVAAAGNDGVQTKMYPAAHTDYVIGVAATDQNDLKSDWGTSSSGGKLASNYGTWVSVCAPGTTIYSTVLSNLYGNKSGTSMASPFVAGLAGLIISQSPTISQANVKRQIEQSCDNIDSLNPTYAGLLGHGRINLARALGYPIVSITSPASASYIKGTTPIIGTASSAQINKYQILWGSGYPASLFEQLYESTEAVTSGTLYDFNTQSKSDGIYTLKLFCLDNSGLSSETSLKVTIDNTPPIALISSPAESAQITGTTAITGTASDANFSYYTLSYAKESDYVTITSTTSAVSSGILGSWNTTGLSGAYKLKLLAYDLAQNSTTLIRNVSVVPQDDSLIKITGTTNSTPNPFDPSTQTETYIHYNLSNNEPVAVYIFNMNGELVYQKSFASGENGAKAGSNLVPWAGNTIGGYAAGNGVYVYKIISLASGKKRVIGTGRIIVMRN